MAGLRGTDMPAPASGTVAKFAFALLSSALLLAAVRLWAALPPGGWVGAFGQTEAGSATIVTFILLPRIAVALLAGAALSLSGAVFQHVLRNPLAEPSLLGVSAGAQLFLSAATLFAPSLLEHGQDLIAIAGAASATTIVFAIAYGRSLSPTTLVMAGLLVNLLCGSFNAILGVLHWQYLAGVFMWSSGSLVQGDWRTSLHLMPRLLVLAAPLYVLARPLSVMTLGDQAASGLGLSLRSMRFAALALAVSLAGVVVSAVGLISFVGLAAQLLAKSFGARRVIDRLIWAPVIGAALLLLADEAVQMLGLIMPELPAGIATALLGAPLLLWMLARLRPDRASAESESSGALRRIRRPGLWLIAVTLLLIVVVLASLGIGRDAEGWRITGWSDREMLLQWRWPRILSALAAGIMLALAGAILQRMTRNAMASPDMLGVSSGAALGVIFAFLVFPAASHEAHLFAAATGACVALGTILLLGRRLSFSPERLLLTGVALTTIFSAFVSFLMVSGDPRLGSLLTWMAGSTYRATGGAALTAAMIAAGGIAVVPLLARWLAILPLGDEFTASVGVNLGLSRLALLLFVALLTGSATLIIGPLSFVGLLAPHLARLAGFHRPAQHLIAAAISGAIVMICADWLGRNLLFPYQIPAGLLATIVAGPYFIWLLRRARHQHS